MQTQRQMSKGNAEVYSSRMVTMIISVLHTAIGSPGRIAIRTLLIAIVVCTSVTISDSQAQVVSGLTTDSSDVNKTVQIEVDGKKISLEQDQVIRIAVSASREPVPALKYRLFPSPGSLKNGDAATLYHRAILFFRQNNSSKDYRQNLERKERGEKVPFAQQTFDELSEILPNSLSEAELLELKTVVESQGETIINEIRLAEHLSDCDWGFDVNKGRPLLEYISFLLPEMQEFRGIARYLALRSRVQIATGDLDSAMETIRLGLKMSKTTEDTRFMVCSLIGVACSNVMLDQVEQFVAAKDAPNLYWALEVLPKPLVSVKPAVRQELEFLRNGAGMKVFQDPESPELSEQQWARRMSESLDDLSQLIGSEFGRTSPDEAIQKAQMLAILLRGYPLAKRKLISWGFDSNAVESMPVAQVLAIHESHMLKVISDEILKCLNLDPKVAISQIEKVTDKFLMTRAVGDKQAIDRELIPIASTLLPAVTAVLEAEQRGVRKIRILQTIEALRLHAAIHQKFPETLNQVTAVPVPTNPDTNQSFFYRKTDQGCELWEMAPERFESDPLFQRYKVYQIQLRK